jgi:hypothetical protein
VQGFCDVFGGRNPTRCWVNHSRPVEAWLRELGLAVPAQAGLVELEDHPELGSTGVYCKPAKIGALAIETLMRLMHRNETGLPDDPREELLSGEWRAGVTLPLRER